MQHIYYIDAGGKDGPHDLVSIMRRIRARKIGPETGIYVDDAETTVPARALPDIAMFFSHDNDAAAPRKRQAMSLRRSFRTGWNFVTENNAMTVYSGALLLLSILLASALTGWMGLIKGGAAAWIAFILMHHFYFIFILRLYRGQPVSAEFFNQQITPVLPKLLISCIVLALMMVGGFFLLVVPFVIIWVLYIFVPFLILDRRFGMIEAMHASRLLLQKNDRRYLGMVALLVVLHLLCLALIIPLPLTLPLFAAALAEMYEEISAL